MCKSALRIKIFFVSLSILSFLVISVMAYISAYSENISPKGEVIYSPYIDKINEVQSQIIELQKQNRFSQSLYSEYLHLKDLNKIFFDDYMAKQNNRKTKDYMPRISDVIKERGNGILKSWLLLNLLLIICFFCGFLFLKNKK